MKIMVFDITGIGRPPGIILLEEEQKVSRMELKRMAVAALGFNDSSLLSVEVKNKNGDIVKKIDSQCMIFVKMEEIVDDPFEALSIQNLFKPFKK